MLVVLTCQLPSTSVFAGSIRIGWESVDITPENPVVMRGGVVSTGVLDPITATVLAMESVGDQVTERVLLISCDLQHITDGNRYAANMLGDVRAVVHSQSPEIRPEQIIMMATHTHVAPAVQADREYNQFACQRIAEAAVRAWRQRQRGGVSYGLGHAVIGHNRIATYRDGSSHMVGSLQHGSTSNPQFSHIEGFEDHSVHLLYTWDQNSDLTGVLINTACPAQVLRGDKLSADYWHDVREQLSESLGPDVHVLPQLSAAGDLATTIMVEKKAETRMQQLMFPGEANPRDRRRKQIAVRLASAVTSVLPYMKNTIDRSPVLKHATTRIELVQGFPEADSTLPKLPVEVHAVRVGDIAIAANPFEMYVDYGTRIKGRSPAVQTFVTQLAGSASYLPTTRAVDGGGYGAISRSCIVGAEAGDKVVKVTLELLQDLWQK